MTNLRSALVAAFLAAATVPAAAATFDPVLDADPFAAEALLAYPHGGQSPALRHYLRGLTAAARLDGKTAARESRLAYSDPHASRGLAWRAMATAGETALRDGQYDIAADLFDRAISEYGEEMPAVSRTTIDQDRSAAMALRGQPGQSMETSAVGEVPLGVNVFGLVTAPVTVEGHDQAAVIDSGSSASVLSTTAAKQLGVHMLSRATSTATQTGSIDTTMAIADTVRIGPVTLHHVIFIVLSDAALSPMGPDNRIDMIIGYPVMTALGRITFHSTGGGADLHRTLSFAPSHPHGPPGNLRFTGTEFMLRVTANNWPLVLYVDTGSNTTFFSKRFAGEFPDRIKGLPSRVVKTIGGNGAQNRQTVQFPTLDLAIADTHVALTNIAVELDGNGSETQYGTVGYDALWAKGGYTIDFGRLNLSLDGT